MLRLTLVLALTCLCNSSASLSEDQFKDIFIGRCQYHQLIMRVQATTAVFDCKQNYEKFMTIFRSSGGACQNANYRAFVSDLQQPIPHDKGLLWSGVQELANFVSKDGQRYVTLSKTLVGYIFDDILLCKNALTSLEGCKSSCSATGASKAFWEIASQYYAENLSGKVVVMLKGKERSTYNTSSIFARIEMKYLSRNVTEVEIWPVRDLTLDKSVKIEKCGSGSLLALESIVKATGRKFTCVDQSRVLLLTQCYLDPQNCPISRSNVVKVALGPISYFLLALLAGRPCSV